MLATIFGAELFLKFCIERSGKEEKIVDLWSRPLKNVELLGIFKS